MSGLLLAPISNKRLCRTVSHLRGLSRRFLRMRNKLITRKHGGECLPGIETPGAAAHIARHILRVPPTQSRV